jgi:hypothetical protein
MVSPPYRHSVTAPLAEEDSCKLSLCQDLLTSHVIKHLITRVVIVLLLLLQNE